MNNSRTFHEYRFGILRLLALVALGTLGLAALAASGVAAEPSGRDGLEAAVTNEMLQEGDPVRGGFSATQKRERTQTNVRRASKDERWAFGTSVVEAPKKEGYYPEGWIFVAKKSGSGWDVGLEGSPEFDSLAREAPTTVVDEEEKDLFAEQSGTTPAQRSIEFQSDSRWFFRLPWTRGTRWKMAGGPHGWATGYDRPYSALDFAGGDQKVRAGGGRVYRMCSSNRGWLRVIHRGGWSTDYYHLSGNIQRRQGALVNRGAFLGYTGTDVSCGGAAYGRHVHFNLRYYTRPISVDGRTLGGWTFQVGSAYGGYAQRKSYIRRPGDPLLNFGP